jgi:hypothetical protein
MRWSTPIASLRFTKSSAARLRRCRISASASMMICRWLRK